MRDLLTKYAKVIVEVGVNLQKDEVLVVAADVEVADMAREVVRQGYLAGAERVIVLWRDEQSSLMDYTLGEGRKALEPAPYESGVWDWATDKKAAYVNLISGDPELYADVDPALLAKASRVRRQLNAKFYHGTSVNDIKWCLVGVPTLPWAKKVCPGLPDEEAVARLWELIAHTMRLDLADSVAAWKEHTEALHHRSAYLNGLDLAKLHYTNSLGTDLWVELPQGYVFAGGSELSTSGVEFCPNMPTEEVFSAPYKYGVNGKVVASIPLFHNGAKVKNFGFRFEKGRIVDYWADEGLEVLKGIVDTDEGSHYLGEVALVPYDSPIQNLGVLFLDTLFDENASCHLAIGEAYPSSIKGGVEMSDEQLETAGLNVSHTHVDFMLGTKDLSIVGWDRQGVEHAIFVDGNFAF